jgi:hypothetical protein
MYWNEVESPRERMAGHPMGYLEAIQLSSTVPLTTMVLKIMVIGWSIVNISRCEAHTSDSSKPTFAHRDGQPEARIGTRSSTN